MHFTWDGWVRRSNRSGSKSLYAKGFQRVSPHFNRTQYQIFVPSTDLHTHTSSLVCVQVCGTLKAQFLVDVLRAIIDSCQVPILYCSDFILQGEVWSHLFPLSVLSVDSFSLTGNWWLVELPMWLTDGFWVTFFGRWRGAVHIHMSHVQLTYMAINVHGNCYYMVEGSPNVWAIHMHGNDYYKVEGPLMCGQCKCMVMTTIKWRDPSCVGN